jgi:hypothetical protein
MTILTRAAARQQSTTFGTKTLPSLRKAHANTSKKIELYQRCFLKSITTKNIQFFFKKIQEEKALLAQINTKIEQYLPPRDMGLINDMHVEEEKSIKNALLCYLFCASIAFYGIFRK